MLESWRAKGVVQPERMRAGEKGEEEAFLHAPEIGSNGIEKDSSGRIRLLGRGRSEKLPKGSSQKGHHDSVVLPAPGRPQMRWSTAIGIPKLSRRLIVEPHRNVTEDVRRHSSPSRALPRLARLPYLFGGR